MEKLAGPNQAKTKWAIKSLLIFLSIILLIFVALLLWPNSSNKGLVAKSSKKGVETAIEKFARTTTAFNKNVVGLHGIVKGWKFDSIDFCRDTVYKKYLTKTYPPSIINVFKSLIALLNDKLVTQSGEYSFIESAYFYSPLDIYDCTFETIPDNTFYLFSEVTVQENFSIEIPKLNSDLGLYKSDFEDGVQMTSDSLLSKSITFDSDTFKNGISFNQLKHFKGLELYPDRLPHLTMANNLTFINTSFNGKLDLSYSVFLPGSKIMIRRCTLPDTIDLLGLKADLVDLRGEIDTTGKICYLNLTGSNISSLNFEYTHFQLYFSTGATENEKDDR